MGTVAASASSARELANKAKAKTKEIKRALARCITFSRIAGEALNKK